MQNLKVPREEMVSGCSMVLGLASPHMWIYMYIVTAPALPPLIKAYPGHLIIAVDHDAMLLQIALIDLYSVDPARSERFSCLSQCLGLVLELLNEIEFLLPTGLQE
jgi:hypothetical protein